MILNAAAYLMKALALGLTLGVVVHGQPITYRPGSLTVEKEGYLLSEGLNMRVIARITQPVQYDNGGQSSARFHRYPDFGACFPHPDGPEKGYVYVSNSENTVNNGGVGAIYFDQNHNIIEYKMILDGSSKNCGGGATPWGTWISCEESYEGDGIWQVGENMPVYNVFCQSL